MKKYLLLFPALRYSAAGNRNTYYWDQLGKFVYFQSDKQVLIVNQQIIKKFKAIQKKLLTKVDNLLIPQKVKRDLKKSYPSYAVFIQVHVLPF